MTESEIVFAVEESPEGGYEAHALGYSIFTEAVIAISSAVPRTRIWRS